jgi:hypothetical protein
MILPASFSASLVRHQQKKDHTAKNREDAGAYDVSPSDPEQEQARQDLRRVPGPKAGYAETAGTTTPQQGPLSGPARDKRSDKPDPDATVKDRNVV